ncbi:hypothetical protein INT43_005796 [Umbelopsis isabellina]|uniref:Zn(2)-C6 fungal-type domain-containing protein n=1 Tax=Mortierella isabellina TaxID=91625 RepID=A0A8H7PIT3_MORIS|nr:hypothetical protein INT43_005796 [Umbelopsis isabellina]
MANAVNNKEKYACDSCRLSKVTCSREGSGCKRCTKKGSVCTYSRSGVIRRQRPRKKRGIDRSQLNQEAAGTNSKSSSVQSYLAADIEATRERLNHLDDPQRQGSLSALSSLSQICANTGIQHEASKLGQMGDHFFLFEEYAIEWANVFEESLRKSGPMMSTAPPDVMDHLRAARPHLVHERSWLVMYYSIILNTVTSSSLKQKLQRNLWFALSDVRVLLEPSETNIRAVVLVLSHASEFAGPSLCWMLATNACRMLQALGINQRHLDRETRERRLTSFWHLNLLDKGLAIIFGRTPTFHREMVREIGLPKLEQIQAARSHLTSVDTPGLFGTHYLYQKILLSHLMDDIWHCLYGEAKPNDHIIEVTNKDLQSWHELARKVLEAAALTEKPFCDAKNAKSIDIALNSIEFHFLYLTILLTRSATHLREQCFDASTQMLNLLQTMAPESKDPYHPIIWQLGKRTLNENKKALAAMERLPSYLKNLSWRNSLAASLEGIAGVFVQHARSAICRQDFPRSDANASAVQNPAFSLRTSPNDRGCDQHMLHSMSFFGDTASSIPISMQLGTGDFDLELSNDLTMFTNSLNADGMFDWLSWDSRSQE